MRRGFLRWRKRDSDLPFWNRKTLLSPRTYSLPCGAKHGQNFRLLNQNKSPLPVPPTNFPPRSSSGVVWLRGAVAAALLDSGVGNSASVAIAGMGHPYLAGVDPLAGERIVVRSHFGGGCRVVVVGVASSESKVQGPRFQVDFRQILWCRLWDRAAL